MQSPKIGNRSAIVLSAVLVIVGLNACSSSSKSSSSSATTTATTPATTPGGTSAPATGAPVTVGAVCGLTGYAPDPECGQALQAAFAGINAKGGINGHQLKVTLCDSGAGSNPTVTGANCYTKLIADSNIVALVGTSTNSGQPLPPDLAFIAPVIADPGSVKAPDTVFPLSGWGQAGGDALLQVQWALQHGFTKPGVVSCQLAGCLGVKAIIDSTWKAAGKTVFTTYADVTDVSLLPQITAQRAAGTTALQWNEAGTGIIAGIKASQSIDYHPATLMFWNCFDERFYSSLPSNTQALCPSAVNADPSALQASGMQAGMDSFVGQGKWKLNANGVNNWAGAQLFADILGHINGPVTRASVLQAARTITNFTNPLIGGSTDFSKPGPIAKYPAVRNWYWYEDTFSGNKLITNPTPVNVEPAAQQWVNTSS